jgi:hypothetical protein
MNLDYLIGAAGGAVVVAIIMGLIILSILKKAAAMKKPPEPPKPVKPSGAPLRMLAVLQREARLLDFLMEDIGGYSDAQVGAGVRELHRLCQTAIKKTLDLEPILVENQDDPVEVKAGYDPWAIRLVGNVTGEPPFKGVVKHQGWRVKSMRVAEPPAGADEFVVMPAEVEMA